MIAWICFGLRESRRVGMCIGRETGGDEKWRGTLIPAIGASPGVHDITESDPPVLYNFSG
jgi:hypothetical protein